jgi:hypothetical protein
MPSTLATIIGLITAAEDVAVASLATYATLVSFTYDCANIADRSLIPICSRSLRRAANGSKRMFLELIHGLFIT